MRTGYSRMLGMAAVVILLSCGDPKSSSTSGPGGGPVQTNRMTIDLKVEANDLRTTTVRVNLNDGQALGESFRLDGGDYLRACGNGICKNMADNDSATSPDYIARFDYQPGVEYVVSFNRQGAQNAPDSHAVVPAGFTIVTPANNQQVTDGDIVLVSWSPTGAPAIASLSYDVDCPHPGGSHTYSSRTGSTDTNADGRESVRIDDIIANIRTATTLPFTRCSIDVTVSHRLQGQIDPAFRQGTAAGIVTRKVNVDYIAR